MKTRMKVIGVAAAALLAGAGEIGAASPGDLVISEIMQNPAAVGDTQGEWVEIYNATGSVIDMDGWTLGDGVGEAHTIDAGGSLPVAAGGFVVLGRNSDPLVNGGYTPDYVYTGMVLGNGIDRVVIREGGVTIDSVGYDDGGLFPDPSGASMELIGPALDNNIGTNWEENVTDVYGDGDYGTPGSANYAWGAPAGPPVIDGTLHLPAYPVSDDSVLVTARIVDDQGVNGASLYYRGGGGAYTLVPMIDAGGGWYEGWIPPHADATVVEYYICAADNSGETAYDPVDAPATTRSYTVENSLPPIAINEVLADPPDDANGDGTFDSYQDEFVELFNAGPDAVDLSGWVLSDDDAPGAEFVFPAGSVIEAGGFVTLFGGGLPAGLPGLVFNDDGRIGNGLSNSGDTIYLSRAGELVDEYTFGAEGSHDESMIRVPDGVGGWTRPSLEGETWNYSPQASNGGGSTQTDLTSWGAVKSLFLGD